MILRTDVHTGTKPDINIDSLSPNVGGLLPGSFIKTCTLHVKAYKRFRKSVFGGNTKEILVFTRVKRVDKKLREEPQARWRARLGNKEEEFE